MTSTHEAFNTAVWLVDRNVAEGRGDAVALRYRGASITYAEVLAQVEAVAAGLRSLGVMPEQRVLMTMLDSPEFAAAFLGAMRIGAVPMLVNPLLPPRDVGAIAADSRARLALVSAERADALAGFEAEAPEIERVLVSQSVEWKEAFAGGGDGSPYPTWAESPGFWLCTSGTTGRPKLVMHRHADLRSVALAFPQETLGAGPEDRCYSVGPMFHAYGLGSSIAIPFSVGGTGILESTRPPTPALVGDIVRTEQPTLFFCIPTFYAALVAAQLPPDTFASVRYAVSAAEALPPEIGARFAERYGVEILDGIGSTEMTYMFICNRPGEIRPGSSGTPVGGYDVRVVDDDGNDVEVGAPGHLLVRGDSAATGYWCHAEATRRTFVGDWVRTGDTYIRNDDGTFTYLGRSDEMLRVGGEWVSPTEVEATLIEHEDVLEAAVVGERDDSGVVRPIAFVIAAPDRTPDTSVLTEFCRSRLAGYKRPKRITVVEALPKTATGKIQRYKLRDG